MERWLNQIRKRVDTMPTKLTQLSYVSFVGTIPNHFQDKKLFSAEQIMTCNNQASSNISGVLSVLSVPFLALFYQGKANLI